jgi:hypothetical protein
LYLAGDLRIEELVADRLTIHEIFVRRATLRAIRRANGQWNVAALLPLPALSVNSPAIKLEDVTLVMEDAARPQAGAQTVQSLDLTLTPVEPTPQADDELANHFRLVGMATGPPAREIRVEGEVATSGEYDLKINVAGLEVSRELMAALPGIHPVKLKSVDVSGRADIALQISRRASEPPNWSAAIQLDRGRILHDALPEPITELSFTGHADANHLQIERLACRCGPASVALAGERAGWAANAPLALAAKFTGVQLNERVLAILPKSCAHMGERFQPAGIVDAELRLAYDGVRWRPQLTANSRGMYLTDAEKFPYRLQQTTGRLEYQPAGSGRPDELRLELTGIGGGRPVRIQAQLTHIASPEASPTTAEPPRHPLGWVEVSGADIPFHEQLTAALPSNVEQLVRSFRPQGAFDFRFRAEWKELSQAGAEVTHEIRLKDCAVQYERFPYPLRHVQGLVTQRAGVWTIHDVEGRGWNDSTVVVCRGNSSPTADAFHTDLTVQASNMSLDDNLKFALPPAVQQAWNEFRPQGRVDFTAHAVCEPGQSEPRIEAVFQPRDRSVSIEPLTFPYRLEQIEGVATYNAGRIDVQNVIARHDRAVYSAAAGTWLPAPGGWQLQLSGLNVDRLTPHRDLVAALPRSVQRVLDRLQPAGTFGVYNSNLSLAKRTGSDQLAAAWDVNVDCHHAKLHGELPLQSLTGGIHLTGRTDGQSPYASGELALDSLVWNDVQFTNVRGPLWADSASCLFGEAAAQKQSQPPRRITADAYGGSLAANVEILPAAAAKYKLDLALGGANLARFANERLGGPSDMSGTASGRLLLSGTANAPQSLSGRGELNVVDANIYELPVLVAMLKVLKVRTPDTTAFNRCDMQFAIQGEQIHFDKLNLLGDALSLYGTGDSGFDRRLDLVFYALLEPANLPIPILKTIAGQVSQQTLQLKVVGTWDQADVQPQTLPGFNQILEQIQSSAATMAPSAAARELTRLPQ